MLTEWAEKLSEALPKFSGDRITVGNGATYQATLERGDTEDDSARIASIRIQHGIGATRYLPKAFFDSNEYRLIMELSSKLDGCLARARLSSAAASRRRSMCSPRPSSG